MKRIWGLYAQVSGLALLLTGSIFGAETAGTIGLTVTNGNKNIDLPRVSGVDEFKVLRSTNLAEGFKEVAPGAISGYNWQQPGQGGLEFFKVEMTPKSSQAVQNANLLNRIAYGPTPDELERLAQIDPDTYVREQLAPENLSENLAIDQITPTPTDWTYVTVTGSATTTSTIYIGMAFGGQCYVDDIQLVRGAVAGVGTNNIPNGDFENGLTGWQVGEDFTNSVVTTVEKHSGTSALHLVATEGGSGVDDSVWRTDLRLSSGQQYTLSYWYKRMPGSRRTPPLIVRLSGAEAGGNGIYSRPGTLATRLAEGTGSLNDLAAWHSVHAVESKKQLLEVMLQFLENHFVTQQTKSRDYFDGRVSDGEEDFTATNLEYRELQRWRQALLNPNCTFHDLLKISAESPAMIIYLDTVNSRGDGANIANENYARELLELFTFGVDNGYDQNDITIMSRAWTGWTVRRVDYTNQFNPFAPASTNLNSIWAFNYRADRHSAGPKVIFPGKTVPTRFGAPYAGRDYELRLGSGASTNWQYVTTSGTASSSTLYLYLTGTGDCYIDDIKIVSGNTAEAGTNAVRNGDFESGLTGWIVSPNMSGSTVASDVVRSGSRALHMVSSSPGSSSSTAIRRADLGLVANQPYTISYWYRPGTNMNGNLVLRLSGNGISSSPGTGTNSVEEAYKVLAHLADQPFTQEYISVKLCRLLVHDDFHHGYDFTDPNLSPEGQLVRACMQAWENGTPKGQIRKVLEVILNSELFRSEAASMQKVKTPFEFTVSAVRALRARMADGTYTANTDGNNGVRTPINRMGRMRLFDREEPDGWPEAGAPWVSAGTLTERLRFVQSILMPTPGGDASGNNANPVRLLKAKLPASAWRDAAAVADYFLGIIYPGEGRANLDEYRQMAVWYLNTADNGAAGTLFSALDPNGPANGPYDLRVRGMVAMLMTFPRFQEQ